MNIEKHRAFLDSLEGEKGWPEEMFGVRFDEPLFETPFTARMHIVDAVFYLQERCRRAESRQIPDLKEKVKELVRDAMDTAFNDGAGRNSRSTEIADMFRALCAPDKGGEVKP